MTDFEARIAPEVGRFLTNSSNWPRPIAVHMLGRDLSEQIDKLTAALLPVIAEAKGEALTAAAKYFDQRATKLTETVVDLPERQGTMEADIHRYGAYAAEAQHAARVLARMAHDLRAPAAPAIGPDCQANKHRACDGRALDEATDEITRCQCACHP